jgi:hypothetical protein
MVILMLRSPREQESGQFTSLMGLQKPLHKRIKVEEEKLWRKECGTVIIYETEAWSFIFP